MRRWVVRAGVRGLDSLEVEQAEMPEPGAGEVRIRVHAASLNARDWFVLNGGHNRFIDRDLVPLADGAGTVDAVGPGVKQWILGDRVTALYFKGWVDGPPTPDMGMGRGSRDEDGMLAEYVVLPEDRLARVPDSLDWIEASTIFCAGLTAWNALYGANPISRHSKVLTLGTGGVSIFALLFARAAGARIFSTSSQPEKLDRLRSLGVEDVLNYAEIPEWGKEIFARTGGVDKVIETGGSGSLNQSLEAASYSSELAVMGFKAQPGGDLNPYQLMTKQVNIRGIGVGSAAMYNDMAKFIDTHKIRPIVDKVFDFEDAKRAYEYQDSSALFGKIAIKIG